MSKRSHKPSLFQSRVVLVLVGVGLGYLARLVFGAPSIEDPSPHQLRPYEDKLKNAKPEVIDIPLERPNRFSPQPWEYEQQGLVPPIRIPGVFSEVEDGKTMVPVANHWDHFSHDASAAFHPHGEELCASGCAASRHPTAELSRPHFERLMQIFASEPMDQTSNALEELLFFGPQTRGFIEQAGFVGLDRERGEFLWAELQKTHARISIRVIDEDGHVRTWLNQATVPFDRRHVFDMQTSNLQPLVTSGTVKRVGLNHLWTRL